jgi:hypothetical protein
MIGIISDGTSDFDVLKKLTRAIFEKHHKANLNDSDFCLLDTIKFNSELHRFSKKCKVIENYGIHTAHAKEFIKEIENFLTIAVGILYKRKGESLTNKDVIILNTDSETVLVKTDNYFQEWFYFVYPVLWKAIEHFYEDLMKKGYTYEQIPLILPIIPFPSIEILVRAAMPNYDEKYRNFNAKPDLKQEVWGTDSIPTAYLKGNIQASLEKHIIPQNIEAIYRHIPEARKFIQILSFNLKVD